ncbi:Pentatricopeptide repeat-containing protein [Ananas comosus]|uniref:Pentatricopeptide repeat-containing protein n=1 Tax=Ananas comosus TaxID=4615 RepID=A0A199UJC8_ANACO|nr:Pentatricopeptide repeat-containing protein [Ananas comosus]
MRRSLLFFFFPLPRHFSSSSSSSSSSPPEIPTLYSFLQPSIFALRPKPSPPPPQNPNPPLPPKTLTLESLEPSLLSALRSRCPTILALLPLPRRRLPPPLPSAASSLLSLLSCDPSPSRRRLSLKRAFAAAVFLLDRCPHAVSLPAAESLFRAFADAAAPAPALALVKSMLKNRFFPPFYMWGHSLICIAKGGGGGGGGGDSDSSAGFAAFLRVFEENCRIAMDDKNESMKPDLASCNAVLDGCCRDMCSVSDAERVLEMMSKLGLSPDSDSFGSLAYLYASKGIGKRIEELDRLLDALGFSKKEFFKNLISGCVKAGNFESVSSTILRASKERKGDEGSSLLDDEIYIEVAKCYLDNGRIKELASLIITTQELESSIQSVRVDCSFGFGIVNACVVLGMLDRAHNILDEMTAQGACVGLGVYSSILRAYCKEQRTAEAAQLVMEISAAGLQLDVGSYDALIDVSMSAQDFQSAFSLFRDMREARLPDIKTSYLTIMTGLMENQRPELMASFLDSIVDDPRVEIATHDWNSIIHAFCKVGRLEDARRTYRRMVFLRFEPNSQTYLSLITGYVSIQKYFSVLILWTEVRKKGIDFDHDLIDAFLFALVKGGFFDAAMQVVEKAQELKIFVDKWRHKQAFMETHKKLKVAKLRKRNFRKMEALVAFKNWAGLNA